MKQVISRKLLVAGIALLTVPALTMAQKEKEKEKDKEVQNIVITRTGDKDEKLVIEVEGDKVKINGKDVKDIKDVNVHVNNLSGTRVWRGGPGQESWNFNFNENDHFSLFSEDENRAMLGVTTEGHDKGAEIKSITKESAAEKAGLKKGDVLTKIDDKKIETTDDVTEAIRAHKPGEKVNITYLRDGKEQKVSAELGKWKGIKMNSVTMPRIAEQWNGVYSPEPPRIFGNGENFYAMGRPRLGLSIQDTDEGVGVKVLEVSEESAAHKAGIKENDIILSVDDIEVKGTQDVTRAMREKDKSSYNFKINRGGKTQNIEVKIPKKLKTADL